MMTWQASFDLEKQQWELTVLYASGEVALYTDSRNLYVKSES